MRIRVKNDNEMIKNWDFFYSLLAKMSLGMCQ
jgi:hypothetical protein